MRTDPTDNGGLFIGRRPGTAPIRYRELPDEGSATRRRVDGGIAGLLLAGQVLVNLLFWGPIPAGSLWVAAQVQYHTDSVSLGLALGFLVMILVLMVGLSLLKRLDHAWVLARRAAGHDQRHGLIGPIFATCAALGAAGFTFWLLFIGGLGSSVISGNGQS
jgi:hypothetical protein